MTGIGAILSYQVPGIMDIEQQSDDEKEEAKDPEEEEPNIEELENMELSDEELD